MNNDSYGCLECLILCLKELSIWETLEMMPFHESFFLLQRLSLSTIALRNWTIIRLYRSIFEISLILLLFYCNQAPSFSAKRLSVRLGRILKSCFDDSFIQKERKVSSPFTDILNYAFFIRLFFYFGIEAFWPPHCATEQLYDFTDQILKSHLFSFFIVS